MRLYVGLLIDGKEEGPRVPADLTLEQYGSQNASLVVQVSRFSVGPATRSGISAVRFFTAETGEDHMFTIYPGPIAEGQSLYYS